MKKAFLPAIIIFSLFAIGFNLLLTTDKKTINELQNSDYIRFIKNQSGDWDSNFSQPIFLNQPVNSPIEVAKREEGILAATSPTQNKWIEVNLSEPQTLYAHEGDRIIYTFLVSGGKWAATPTGEFRIWGKYRYSTMIGGSIERGDYYNLPNVPYTMYFSGGVALHGAYWHNNFGKPMSHGCVNIAIPDAEKLFFWANPNLEDKQNVALSNNSNPGTKVVVHY